MVRYETLIKETREPVATVQAKQRGVEATKPVRGMPDLTKRGRQNGANHGKGRR